MIKTMLYLYVALTLTNWYIPYLVNVKKEAKTDMHYFALLLV